MRQTLLFFGLLPLLSCRIEAASTNYITRIWQTDDGLPQSSVTAVVQSRDGYLWLGTRSGLARFDGVRFTVFNGGNTPEMQSPHVTSLFDAPDGALWIGHEDGELTCYQSGKFRAVPVQANWRGGKILAIGADAARDLWLMNQDGELVRLKDGRVIPSRSTPVTRLLSMAHNPRGGFWIQRDGEVSTIENGQLRSMPFEGPADNRYVQGIGASRDGGLWVMTEQQIRKWRDGKWTDDSRLAPWEWAPVHTVIELRDGSLAAASADHGLYVVAPDGGSLQFCRTNGFTSDWVTSLCQDREGNLWAGSGNGGLIVLRPGHVRTFNPPDNWEGRAVLSVAAGPDDSIYVGSEGAGLYRMQQGLWSNVGTDSGTLNRYIWSVTFDAKHRPWVGTWGGGVLIQEGDRFDLPPELDLTTPTPAMLALPDGDMLIGTGIGLLRHHGGAITWLGRKPELISPDVRAVRAAPDGTIWFGMSGGGLGWYRDGKLRQFRRREGLSNDFVQCLHLEPDGTLWIGTFGGGLNRLKDGKFSVITHKEGLPDDVICDIQDDRLGNFWISSHGGLTRVSKADLNSCAEGWTRSLSCLSYGLSDGLPTLECSGGFQPAGCRTSDGRLWFPTAKGLISVDPNNVEINRLPPPVVIEEMRVDGEPVGSTGAGNPLRIASGRHRFEFDYTGLSFVAPEKVRFKHRLAGLDTEWVEAETLRRAYYSYIPPGDYQFQVHACNNDGVWNEDGAVLAFTVLPAFWQTWWFRVMVGAFGLGAAGWIVWFDTRRRMHRKLEGLEREQAIERERARIAKDIHDDLGAGLTRISLLSESVPAEQAGSVKATEAFNRIFTTTHEMTQAMDEIVWAVNPKHDTLDSLANYLGKFAQDFLDSAGVACRLDVPWQLPNWRLAAEVRHNLFLGFKESLNNVARHAAATEVRVSLTVGNNAFALVIEDDGKGFNNEANGAAPAAPHRINHRNGLANMRQRLSEIGGRCEINTAMGKGTRVEFHVAMKPGAT